MTGWIKTPFAQCFTSFFYGFLLQLFYSCFRVFFSVFPPIFYSVFTIFLTVFFMKPGVAMEMTGDFGAGYLGGLYGAGWFFVGEFVNNLGG